ncbi:MAG: hypothetical protein ACUVRV_03465 [Cyanobacteriota bacterium]
MARSKLSEQEQQQIVSTYRGSPATAVELAEQFRVSISTIARILKENIEADEYQQLVSRKRSAARRKGTGEELRESQLPESVSGDPPLQVPVPEATPAPSRTRRRSSSLRDPEAHQQVLPLALASSATAEAESERVLASLDPSAAPEPTLEQAEDFTDTEQSSEELGSEELELVAELEEELEDEEDEEIDEDSDLEDLENEEEEEEEEDKEEDEDSAYFLGEAPEADSLAEPGYQFQVLPLEELIPPETCYAVIDRYQELATRPLKEFFNSGSLPDGIDSANTLPIFDNHRVARRFSEMSRRGSNTYPPYRVIQFPGYILETVRTQLQNKGITHLLMDGQIYKL